jgi:tetratricopeptide (TPR) repeat protein
VTAAEIARTHQARPSNVSAWDTYLRALPLLRQHTKTANQEAVWLLNTAIALSPGFAAAHARLSACRTQAAYYSWDGPSDASVSEALRLARQGIALDAEEPLAFDALASAYQFLNDVEKAEQAARRAIELFPACTATYGTLIIVLAFQGRTDEALEFFAQSERTSPRDIDRSGRLMGLVFTYLSPKHYEDTISAAEQYLSLRPNWFGAHAMMAATLALMGRTAEASQAKDRGLKLVPHYNLRLARNGPMLKRPEDAETLLDGMRQAGIPE